MKIQHVERDHDHIWVTIHQRRVGVPDSVRNPTLEVWRISGYPHWRRIAQLVRHVVWPALDPEPGVRYLFYHVRCRQIGWLTSEVQLLYRRHERTP